MNYIGTLYLRYTDMIYGVCLKYLKDAELCKDATMDIFELLPSKLEKYTIENFKGWLLVLAKNHCMMILRKKRIIITDSDSLVMYSDNKLHLENDILEKEANLKKLEDCLQALDGNQKKSIELFFLEKKCYNEIAAITGYEWNKVRSYIQNGKRNLKLCLDEKQMAFD